MPRHRITDLMTVHWSKDFVEHLRTVHFTLIAVCVGLILILSRTNSPALAQIRQILKLKKEWPPRGLAYVPGVKQIRPDGSIYGFEPKVVWPHGLLEGADIEQFVPPGLTGDAAVIAMDWSRDRDAIVRFTPTGFFPNQVVRLTYQVPNWYPAPPDKEWDSVARFPVTLQDFRAWWNSLQAEHPCYFPAMVLTRGSFNLYPFGVKKLPARLLPADSADAIPAATSKSIGVLKFNYDAQKSGDDSAIFLALDKKENEYEFNILEVREGSLGQAAIIAVVNSAEWGWTKGPFEKSFSALAGEASGLEPEDLEEVEKTLTSRLANRAEEFEAVGMKFPISDVAVWGSLILLSIQLYFFLYLKQLSGKLCSDDPGWDTPWICMNQSRFAQGVYLFTVTALPVGAMLLIAYRGSERLTGGTALPKVRHLLSWMIGSEPGVRWGISLYLFAIVAASVFGILSWRFRPRLSHTEANHCSAQLFE